MDDLKVFRETMQTLVLEEIAEQLEQGNTKYLDDDYVAGIADFVQDRIHGCQTMDEVVELMKNLTLLYPDFFMKYLALVGLLKKKRGQKLF